MYRKRKKNQGQDTNKPESSHKYAARKVSGGPQELETTAKANLSSVLTLHLQFRLFQQVSSATQVHNSVLKIRNTHYFFL